MIGSKGISLLPITSVEVHHVSNDILSTGVDGLDETIDKKGIYVGSTTLISGTSGVGKTSLAMSVCIAAMKQNKRALFFTLEESKPQLKRNMKSLGFDLESFEKKGLMKIVTSRPTALGIEAHLVSIYDSIENFKPDVVVLDPITDLVEVGTKKEVRGMIVRIIDYMKNNLITVVFTALLSSGSQTPNVQMSSMVDNWINLDTTREEKENQPFITIVKTRGMNHARKSFLLHFSNKGLKITLEKNKEYFVISFSDNGIGIDLKKHSEKMFKPFQQFSANESGMGIGLHISNTMVRKNDGFIKVKSEPENGTTFRVYLKEYNT